MGYTAVVLVGGVGSRLRPLTLTRPKPLIPLVGKPLVDRIIEWLRGHGYTRFILPAKYLGRMIEDYYRGVNDVIVKVVDSKDTADAVRLVSDLIGSEDNILISMGDVICNADFNAFMKYHLERGGIASIALKEVDNPLHYGVVIIDENSRIKHFVEKPASIELYVISLAFSRVSSRFSSNLVNTGFYIVNNEVLKIIREYPSLMDWGKHVFPYLVEQGFDVYGWIMPPYTYWEDLGRPENYVKAVYDVLDGKVSGYYPLGKMIRKGVYIGNNAVVEGKIIPPVYIGPDSFVDDRSVVGPYISIEEGCEIRNSRLSYSILWEHVVVHNSEIMESVIMNNVTINSGCKVLSSIIGANVNVPSSTMVYGKIIEPVLQI
ncbi:MAG: NDP-sugar synthase [Staphylothermus sp.]|nr:NDP-sugar synthase [Staphylothermus sp.]